MQLFSKNPIWMLMFSIFLLAACSPTTPVPPKAIHSPQSTEDIAATTPLPTEKSAISPTKTKVEEVPTPTLSQTEVISDPAFANILSVVASGSENAYTFAVEIRSPDTGCEQYANWWEVVSEDGELIYRRILGHSHVSEQPFTRSGGLVAIAPDTIVIVRAHMYPTGYGGAAYKGSFSGGFEEIQLEADFAPELEEADPLPDGCAF